MAARPCLFEIFVVPIHDSGALLLSVEARCISEAISEDYQGRDGTHASGDGPR